MEGEEVGVGGGERTEVCGEGKMMWWTAGRWGGLTRDFFDVFGVMVEVEVEGGVDEVWEDVVGDSIVQFVEGCFKDFVADSGGCELFGE